MSLYLLIWKARVCEPAADRRVSSYGETMFRSPTSTFTLPAGGENVKVSADSWGVVFQLNVLA